MAASIQRKPSPSTEVNEHTTHAARGATGGVMADNRRARLPEPARFLVMDVTSPRLIRRIFGFPSEGRLSRAVGERRTMKSPIRNTLLLGVLLGLAIGLGGYTFIYSKGYSYL